MGKVEEFEAFVHRQMKEIQVNDHAVNKAILSGILRGKKKNKRSRKMTYAFSIAAIIFLSFTILMRVSPAFAQVISSIPGIGAIVSLTKFDKGIEDIVTNDYYEEIGKSMTVAGISLTLDGVIADESGMLLSYTLIAPFSLENTILEDVFVKQNGKHMEGAVLYNWGGSESSAIVKNTIQHLATNSIDYTDRNFEFFATFENNTFRIPFILTKEIAAPIVYPIEQTVEIASQKITIHSVEISPLRAAIDYSLHEDNEMNILGFDHVELIDENGEVWGNRFSSAVGFRGVNDKHIVTFIESNYFRQPQELYLVLGNAEAVPKNRRDVVIDFDKKEVLSLPDEFPLRFENIHKTGFDVRYKSDRNSTAMIFNEGIDANGKIISILLYGSGMVEDESYMFATLETDDYVNPVTFKLNGFQYYLEGTVKTRVK